MSLQCLLTFRWTGWKIGFFDRLKPEMLSEPKDVERNLHVLRSGLAPFSHDGCYAVVAGAG